MNENKQSALSEITNGLNIERRLDGTVSINISEMLFRKIESALSESAGALALIRANAAKEKPVQRPTLPVPVGDNVPQRA